MGRIVTTAAGLRRYLSGRAADRVSDRRPAPGAAGPGLGAEQAVPGLQEERHDQSVQLLAEPAEERAGRAAAGRGGLRARPERLAAPRLHYRWRRPGSDAAAAVRGRPDGQRATTRTSGGRC